MGRSGTAWLAAVALLLAAEASAQEAPPPAESAGPGAAESGAGAAPAAGVVRTTSSGGTTDEGVGSPAAGEAGVAVGGGAGAESGPLIAIGSTSSYDAPFTLAGWVETFYSWNFNEPANGITAFRGFDNRHNSFELANVVLDLHWDWEDIVGRIMLQWGTTPATYYLAEPLSASLGSGVGDSSLALWQFLQEANVGYRIPIGSGLLVEAGLFISPIGPEAMAVASDFLFSRSNLFYGLPFYHSGLRFSYHLDDSVALLLWAVNGWNSILDGNDEKSLALQLALTFGDLVTANVIYFTGVERPGRAPGGGALPERQAVPGDPVPWRHMLDLNATITPSDWLGLIAQVNGGFEPNRIGLSAWVAGALSVRVRPVAWLGISARGDFFWERVPTRTSGGVTETAGAIFWNGVEWVSGTTVGIDLHPEDHVSLRLEYRHDEAAAPLYFRGAVATDAVTGNYVASTGSQDTVTLGSTAWF